MMTDFWTSTALTPEKTARAAKRSAEGRIIAGFEAHGPDRARESSHDGMRDLRYCLPVNSRGSLDGNAGR